MRIIKPKELRNEINSVSDIKDAKKTESKNIIKVELVDGRTYLVDMDPNYIESEFNPGDIEVKIMNLLKKSG